MKGQVMKTQLLGAVFAAVLASGPACGGGIPVIDVGSIAQAVIEYQELLTQTGLMNDTLRAQFEQVQQGVQLVQQGTQRFEQLQRQIGQLERQIDAMTGSRDMAGLLDRGDAAYGALRDVLSAATDGMDGSAASGAFTALLAADAPKEAAAIRPFDATGRFARAHRDATDKVYMALASADAVIAAQPAVAGAYDRLNAEIDNTEDVKAALDLNARIAVENGRAIARLTHLISTMIASDAAIERRNIAREEDFMSNNALRDAADVMVRY